VQGLGHFRTTRVAAGDSFSVCLSDSGDIRQFGSFRSSDGLLGNAIAFEPFKPSIPNKVSQVAAGMDFLLALDVAGNVWASGNAQQGQLGEDPGAPEGERPRTAAVGAEEGSLCRGGRVQWVCGVSLLLEGDAGLNLSRSSLKNGYVYSWGLNGFRQCGVAVDEGGFLEIIVGFARYALLS
jgi:regulator of chromosome condensation